ncbi:MAG: DUF6440 family protein [Lachnospiraceae bacterium]|nr:DUF6440 family protein [Lachnospiraceae bacterium]
MASKEERFKVIVNEGNVLTGSGQKTIIVDRETGVNYLWIKSGYAGGLTPLLGPDGKPIISVI